MIFLIDNHKDEFKICSHLLLFGFDTHCCVSIERVVSDIPQTTGSYQNKVVASAIAYDTTTVKLIIIIIFLQSLFNL